MTRHLDNAFGLPHLDDLMKEQGVLPESNTDVSDDDANMMIAGMERAQQALTTDDTDHGKKMDEIYSDTIDHARKLADLGYNMDPARSPRAFEVAANLYKTAMDAANSKRDAQLKAKQLQLSIMKFELERQQMTGDAAPGTVEAKGIVVEDRNELIKRLREQAKEK